MIYFFVVWFKFVMSRNDMESVGVKAGCSLTLYTEGHYGGERATAAGPLWLVLEESPQFAIIHNNVASIKCLCLQ